MKIIQEWLKGWNLPKRIFNIIPAPYYITSIILTVILILIYGFLGSRVINFDWGYNKYNAIILCTVIGFLLFGIQFFLNKMRDTFEELGNLFENGNLSYKFRNEIQRNFVNSKLYYLILLFVVLSFIIIKIKLFSIAEWDIFYYGEHPSFWAFVLDIYENLLLFISIYLLATILWIIVNIFWSIDIITSALYKNNLKINIFKADKMGGLRPLRDLIASFSIYYFILIILFIMIWAVPANYSPGPDGVEVPHGYNILPYESELLIIIWLIGVAFFIWGWYSIRKLLFGKFEGEINHISDLCQCKTQQLSDVVSKDDSSETEKHLNQISNALDALHKERERILEFGARPMDIKTFLLFLSSSLSSLTAIIKTLTGAGDMKIVGFVIDKLPHIDQLFDYFNQIISNIF